MSSKEIEVIGLTQDSEIVVMAGTSDGSSSQVARMRGTRGGAGAPIIIPLEGQLAPGTYDLVVLQIDWHPASPPVDYKLREQGGDRPLFLSSAATSYPSTSIGTTPVTV